MSKELSERKASLDALRSEITELADVDEPTDEQVERLDDAVSEFEAAKADYDKAVERAKKLEEIRSAEIREPGVAPAPEVHIKRDRNIWDLTEARVSAPSPKEYRTEMVSRGREAIETARFEHFTDAQRESAVKLIERTKNPEIAEHILKTGSPEYHAAFEDYVTGDTSRAMSLTGANGGFLVPFTLDPTIILTNDGATNPFRDISRIETITTDDWNGVSSAGVTAEWLAEATEAADASPTLAQPSITVHKAAAYLEASIEVAQDSNFAANVGSLVADAKARLEEAAFATGTGTSQPVGIVTALNLTTASRTAGSSGAASAADLVAADIYALDNNLGDRYRPNATFVGNKTIWNEVRQLGTANNFHAFWVDFGGGRPASLIGYPVRESTTMDSTIVSGSNDNIIVLGDFRNYVIVDRVGLAIAYNPLVVSTGSGRPTGEVGWFAYWRVGADSVNDAAFQMLRV